MQWARTTGESERNHGGIGYWPLSLMAAREGSSHVENLITDSSHCLRLPCRRAVSPFVCTPPLLVAIPRTRDICPQSPGGSLRNMLPWWAVSASAATAAAAVAVAVTTMTAAATGVTAGGGASRHRQ